MIDQSCTKRRRASYSTATRPSVAIFVTRSCGDPVISCTGDVRILYLITFSSWIHTHRPSHTVIDQRIDELRLQLLRLATDLSLDEFYASIGRTVGEHYSNLRLTWFVATSTEDELYHQGKIEPSSTTPSTSGLTSQDCQELLIRLRSQARSVDETGLAAQFTIERSNVHFSTMLQDGAIDIVLFGELKYPRSSIAQDTLYGIARCIRDGLKISHHLTMRSKQVVDRVCFSALVTQTGHLVEAQPGFFEAYSKAANEPILFPLSSTRSGALEGPLADNHRYIFESHNTLRCLRFWRRGKLDRLTEREIQCAEWRCRGLKITEIAGLLSVSHSTASTYLRRALEKLDLETARELRHIFAIDEPPGTPCVSTRSG